MGKKKKKIDVSEKAVAKGFGSERFGNQLSGLNLSIFSPAATIISGDEAHKTSSVIEGKLVDFLSPLGPKRLLKLNIIKKGRGGKIVTTLKPVADHDEIALQHLVSKLGKALGCRVWFEDQLIYLQGDQRERVKSWVTTQSK